MNRQRFPATVPSDSRPKRPTITRRYEVTWLDRNGDIQVSTRLAPATPTFEEAFSAFARGTLIQTDAGLMAVDDLVPGQMIMTAEGRAERLVWVGSMTIYPASAVPELAPTALTRITGDSFGEGRPMPDLLLGPHARILLRDPRVKSVVEEAEAAYAPARAFVDGDMVIAVQPAAPMPVYHIMLERQGTIRAAGIEVESYHPGPSFGELIDPQLSGLFLALFPQVQSFADFGPIANPRITLAEAERILHG
ncbi:MAG: hypothetical protein RLZZ528_1282 [Pseudomonadota bacterium]|jgi:hypothetical protein